MKIIIANPIKDIKDLTNIAQKAFLNTSDSDLSNWFSFSEMTKAIAENYGLCLKAISDDGSTIGIIYAQQESLINSKEGKEKWVIVLTAVDPKEVGKGIGSLLLKELEKQVFKKGISKLFAYTNKGDSEVINFYKKNGYEDAGWIKDYQYGKDNSAVFFLKYLN